MKADVVIVAYGGTADVDRCLDRVIGAETVASVTVVDNGDGAGATLAVARGAHGVRLPGNPGFGAAVNRGVTNGDAEAVLVLNPDAVLQEDGLRACLAELQTDPTVAAVQGAIVNVTTGREERSAGRALGPVHLAGRLLHARSLLRRPLVRRLARRIPALADHVDRRPSGPQTVEALAATAIVVRRSAFLAVGGFDAGYFLYGEDLDLCARLRDSGWALVALPTTMAYHRSGASSRSNWDRELVWWEGTLRYARAHWHGGSRLAASVIGWCAAAVLVVRSPGRAGTVVRAIGGRR